MRRRGRPAAVIPSWERQSWPLRVLRAFLGITFLYAGVQKLLDPNFLHAGTPDYIGSQLTAFATGSPIRGVLLVAAKVPVLTGLVVAITEIAVGLGTLLGVAPLASAGAGVAISAVLFLSASWHVHPYFLGSDSIYAVAWLAYLIGCVEIEQRAARSVAALSRKRSAPVYGEQRRELLRAGLLGVGTLFVAGVASAWPKKAAQAGAVGPGTRPTHSPPIRPTPSKSSPTPSPSSVTGTPVASLDSIPIGQAIGFTGPGSEPGVLVRLGQNKVVAFSRVCTHAGCLVGYDSSARLLVCPCHGAEFDPTNGAVPVTGPTSVALPAITVAIDKATGKVVLPG
jgi:thiosulfate dehydrogenase [quinone] large subunit